MNTEKIKKGFNKVLNSVVNAIRTHEGKITIGSLLALIIYFIFTGDGEGPTMAVILAGVAGGVSVNDEPATLETAGAASEGLLLSGLDKQVVKIRPSSTPLDQISRQGTVRTVGSMKAEYYAVDTKPFTDEVSESVTGGDGVQTLPVKNKSMFSPTDTLYLPEVEVTDSKGNKSKGLVVYVVDVNYEGLLVSAVNNYSGQTQVLPRIPEGNPVVRMGRAAAELDVQTNQYEALPKKDYNYCQIFKTQIEQSALMRLSNKEVQWSLEDMEESAVVDMRMAMEKSFLFGFRSKLNIPDKGESVYLTGGIWNQTSNEAKYSKMDGDTIIGICKQAFTGCGGSSKKVLLAGSGLIEEINKLSYNKTLGPVQTKAFWGIEFVKIITNFGTLYVAMSETFDQCNHANDGMIIDPAYLVKYSHIPFTAEKLDLRKSGQRNTDAIVITEASCMVLRYPTAHLRIVHDTSLA